MVSWKVQTFTSRKRQSTFTETWVKYFWVVDKTLELKRWGSGKREGFRSCLVSLTSLCFSVFFLFRSTKRNVVLLARQSLESNLKSQSSLEGTKNLPLSLQENGDGQTRSEETIMFTLCHIFRPVSVLLKPFMRTLISMTTKDVP